MALRALALPFMIVKRKMRIRLYILAATVTIPIVFVLATLINGPVWRPTLSRAAHGRPEFSVPGVELLHNYGFEDGDGQVAVGWIRDMGSTGGEGAAFRDASSAHSGSASMKLAPNGKNDGDQPLAVGQIVTDELAGRHLLISGYVLTQGSAVAHIGLITVAEGRPGNLMMLSQRHADQWTQITGDYDVPSGSDVKVVFICWVDGKSGAAWFDDVSLRPLEEKPANGAAGSTKTASTQEATANIQVDASHVIRTIPETLYGANMEWIWNGNGAWLADQNQPDPQILKLTRELGVRLIRYPGGVYSDFYHWKDGIGPDQKRPEVEHLPKKNERSRMNFGTDEALRFGEMVGGELLITVNAGSGTAQEAAEWVRYVNQPNQRVRYWEIGNELYLNDGDLGPKAVTVNPKQYAQRVIEFSRAMRAVDPTIKILAIGGENHGRYTTVAYPDWNKTVLSMAGDQIDYLSVHDAYAPLLIGDSQDIRTVYRSMLAAPQLIAANLETIQHEIEMYAPKRAKAIGIAVTEWGPAFRFDFSSRYLDHGKTLASALFAASALETFIQSPRVDIANFWELNDYSVLGWIGTRNTSWPLHPDWIPTARYYAFQMFTKYFGPKLVQSDVEGPTFDSEAVGLTDAVTKAPDLATVSSLSADGSKLFVITVNRSLDIDIRGSLNIKGFRVSPTAVAHTLNGKSIDANTGTGVVQVPGLHLPPQAQDGSAGRAPGGVSEISVTDQQVKGGAKMSFDFPAHSVTALVLNVAAQ